MLISVALCTYNGRKFISTQLTSILEQDMAVDEIVVCDDCSTDDTVEIIRGFMAQHPAKIKLLQNYVNLGAISTFEKCIGACTGDIIFLADQDDIWYSNRVSRYLAIFAADEKVQAIFSNGDLIDEAGNPLNNNLWAAWGFTPEMQQKWQNNDFAFSRLAANKNVITGATLAFRRKDIFPLLFPFELPWAYWHDTWVGIIASGLGGLRFVHEATIAYRIHQQQQVGLVGAVDKKFVPITCELFQRKLLGLFPAKKKQIFLKDPASTRLRKFLSWAKGRVRRLLPQR